MEIWDNTEMCVFMVRDEGPPIYLPCTGIPNIEWDMAEDSICEYCGSAMEGIRCSNCGGVAILAVLIRGCNFGRAVVTLEGVLPQAANIFYLPEDAELLLCHKCRGDRYHFVAEEVIMRFLHCHQVKKNMPNVAALHPDREERLRLFVGVECDVEMYPDGMESE